MARYTVYARTTSGFQEFRSRLDEAFDRSFARPFLSKTWVGEHVRIHGPGCTGTASFSGGTITGPFVVSWPATMLAHVICDDVARMLKEAGCVDVSVR